MRKFGDTKLGDDADISNGQPVKWSKILIPPTELSEPPKRFSVSPKGFATTSLVVAVLLALIVLTGAGVRLSEAGLGCEDWPNCSEGEIAPEWELHGWIEFGNRLISGFVALGTIVVLIAAYRRTPRRTDLVRWSWGLVAGTLAQVIIGMISVLANLDPAVVGVHFLLSMVLLWNAAVLWVRATSGQVSEPAMAVYGPAPVWAARAFIGFASAVLVSGVLVTGTGPNSGDARASRLALDLTSVARIHGVLVWCLISVFVVLAVMLRQPALNKRIKANKQNLANLNAVKTLTTATIVVALAQAGVGYTQYSLGMPPWLVEIHILGAIVVWSLAILTYLKMSPRHTPQAN